MTNYIVSYQEPSSDLTHKTEVTALNLLHAEKVAKEKAGTKISVVSISSKGN